MPSTFTKIQTVTVGSGGAATIGFTAIPQNYSDLLIKFSGRNVNNAFTFSVQINGTTVTNTKRLYATGSGSYASDTYNGNYTDYSSALASTFGNADLYFFSYSGSTHKRFLVDAVSEDAYTSAYMNFSSNVLASTTAVTSITLVPESGNFAEYSSATIYGIKNS
jgi:hypothetical protein